MVDGRVAKTLIDGSTVDSADPRWRHECLARHVLGKPSLAERRQWLAEFEQRHGRAAADALKDTMIAVKAKQKSVDR
jgi:hypothetical protein